MPRLFTRILVIALTFIVAGCATEPTPIPLELQYQQPSSSASSATIIGSQENSSWADDFTAFVIAVDGKRVMAGRKGWNKPLHLSPGNHHLDVEFNRGVFVANAKLDLTAHAGGTYELKYSTDVAFNGANTYCDFWVVDTTTGKSVTDIVRGPVGGAQAAYVPIFLPAR